MSPPDDAPDEIRVPITEYTKQVAKLAAEEVAEKILARHKRECPIGEIAIVVERHGTRIRKGEISFARLVGFLIGSASLGGGAGALVARLLA